MDRDRLQSTEGAPPSGWILYDDSCGICRRWVPFWENALRRRGFGIAPLQADWVKKRLGIDDAKLLDNVRLLMADGSHLAGPDVYRFAMRRIWWAWPAYLLTSLPGLRQIFDLAYRKVARHRHRISDSCGLPGA
jgi:predicted DCC family thiol-disulfide oxidoreductase YuxK